ncbi:MAG TPA: HAMP domain-containing sensor histidine kinase [Gemmatimonadaceae bacterium]|jgi:signal transduction histidine kinase|nr:HAMP domain-containing sensor histidine kinase [Gemmatimonadaceae bacterium]
MSAPSQSWGIFVLQRLSTLAAVVVTVVCGVDLLWWAWLEPMPLRPAIGTFIMTPDSAAGMLVAAVALWLARHTAVPRWSLILSQLLGAALSVWGILFLVERLSGYSLGIDNLLFGERVLEHGSVAGPLGLNTAAAFTLVGVALMWLHSGSRALRSISGFSTVVALLIAFLAAVGYVNGEESLYGLSPANGMAFSTALGCIALCLGMLFARRSDGMAAILLDSAGGGVLARRLLPAAVIVPMVLGKLWLTGERVGIYGARGGASLFIVATTIVFVWVVTRSARVVHAADLQRARLLDREQVARQEAEGANQAKGNFLAVMSHELRTPLSAIIGYEELLADGITGPVTEAQRQQLSRIKASARHLLQLIDEILTFSRAEAGREQVLNETVPVSAVVDEAVGLVAPLADDKGVVLGVTSPPSSLSARTDPRKVRQILVNLLSNAVKFTEPGGRVTLDVGAGDGRMQFTVRDSGIGIPAEHLERIFDPFWQVEQQPTRRAGGTGLGLSVSRRLAQMMGGDIAVESAVGHGSTFVVTLPR